MGRLWPHNWLAIATGDHEQALPAGGRTEVAGLDDLPFHLVLHAFEQLHEPAPGDSATLRVRHQELLLHRHALALSSHGAVQLHYSTRGLVALGDQWSPLKDLLHVLQADHTGLLLAAPFEANPR
ncbi:hypothetical protein D3C76_1379560 [compost metagenome]